MEYGIKKKEFITKIEKRLEDVIDKTAEEQGQFITTQYALSSAFEKIDFYETIIDLDAKADPYIFQSIIKAVSNSTKIKKTMGASSFIGKLTKVIQEEMERKEKERQKAIDDWNEIYKD